MSSLLRQNSRVITSPLGCKCHLAPGIFANSPTLCFLQMREKSGISSSLITISPRSPPPPRPTTEFQILPDVNPQLPASRVTSSGRRGWRLSPIQNSLPTGNPNPTSVSSFPHLPIRFHPATITKLQPKSVFRRTEEDATWVSFTYQVYPASFQLSF